MESGPRVAVIGGGIIGLSIAWRLSADALVTLYDAGPVGNQASWAGAGMLAPGGEFDESNLWSELAQESLALFPEYVEELEQASGLSIDFRRCGAFQAAFTDGEAEWLRCRAEKQNAIGIYSEQFHPARVPGLREGVVAAQYYPSDSVVNPRDLIRALVIACRRQGVELREHEPVRDIRAIAPADAYVISAGAWSSRIAIFAEGEREPSILPAAVPVRGHLVGFEEPTGVCDTIIRHGEIYLLRRDNNLVIAGASMEHAGFDATIDGGVAADLAKRAVGLVPALALRGYMAWNGLRPGTEAGHPIIGRLAHSTIWLAYGHFRNGILLAPATAKGIAREILAADLTPASSQTDSLSLVSRLQ